MNQPWAIWKVEKEEYKLKLSAEATIDAERKLGESLMMAMTKMDQAEVRITVLHAAMKKNYPDMSYEDTLNLYDTYMDGGGTLDDLFDVIMEVYKVSGFMRRGMAKEKLSLSPEPSQT